VVVVAPATATATAVTRATPQVTTLARPEHIRDLHAHLSMIVSMNFSSMKTDHVASLTISAIADGNPSQHAALRKLSER
jgi:hypothetical protein